MMTIVMIPYLVDTAKLELRLLGVDTVQHEVSFSVVQQPEQVTRLLDLNHVYATDVQEHRRLHEVGKRSNSNKIVPMVYNFRNILH